jgi:hypothetical protein
MLITNERHLRLVLGEYEDDVVARRDGMAGDRLREGACADRADGEVLA